MPKYSDKAQIEDHTDNPNDFVSLSNIDKTQQEKILDSAKSGDKLVYAWLDSHDAVEGIYKNVLPEYDDFGKSVLQDMNNSNYRIYLREDFGSTSNSIQIYYKDFLKIYNIKKKINDVKKGFDNIDNLNHLNNEQIFISYDTTPFREITFEENFIPLKKFSIIFWDDFFEVFIQELDSLPKHTRFKISRQLNVKKAKRLNINGFMPLRTMDILKLTIKKELTVEYLHYPQSNNANYFKCLVITDSNKLPKITINDLYVSKEDVLEKCTDKSLTKPNKPSIATIANKQIRTHRYDTYLQDFINILVRQNITQSGFIKELEENGCSKNSPYETDHLIQEMCNKIYLSDGRLHYTSYKRKKSIPLGTLKNYFNRASQLRKKQAEGNSII